MISRESLRHLLQDGVELREVEPGLFSLYSPDDRTNSYDEAGALAFYDLVACNRFYNRIMWGYRTSQFETFCRDALGVSEGDWVLDAGCGSLAFTAPAYAACARRPTVFLDQSLKLLRTAKGRLTNLCGALPDNVVFLHADVRRLPFKENVFGTIVAMNILHVVTDAEGLLRELVRVRKPGGNMVFTTLVESGRWSDRYLRMWGRAGELIPRTPQRLRTMFEDCSLPVDVRVEGNMSFFSCRA